MLVHILQLRLCWIHILHQKKNVTLKSLSQIFSPCLFVDTFSILLPTSITIQALIIRLSNL